MTDMQTVTICVDALGGDAGPDIVLEGCAAALKEDKNLNLILTGPKEKIEPFALQYPGRVEAVPTTQVISMSDHPAQSVRAKKDSSIVVGCKLVKEGRAQGFFSAGSTGACLTAATLIMGRIKGVTRPALAVILPTSTKEIILTDNGANADCKPEYLVQFAHMAAAYAGIVLERTDPSVALLNIGEEETKGSQFALEAYALLKEHIPNFAGNAEGGDLSKGTFDIVVTDGFTGNVALKTLEGTASMLFSMVKQAFFTSTTAKIGALLVRSGIVDIRARMDPDTYGGAPLLGVKGVCIIGHGSAGVNAIKNGTLVAARAARGGLADKIAQKIASDQ